MALILNIDTAVDIASVCLAKDGKILSLEKNVRKDSPKESFVTPGENQKDHAAWLHPAIKEIFEKNNSALKTVDAIAVTGGPGSYTGLRIGMATAKGICYALNKPLITLNTLQVMANAAKIVHKDSPKESFVTFGEIADLLCPMIDARRMEVFTAIYSKDLQIIKEPAAIEINEKSFDEELSTNSICFFGNGSIKFQSIKNNHRAIFSTINSDASSMIGLAEEKFQQAEFADLAYAEPLYLKEFHGPAR